jgi:DNA-binding transcriptional LysR family regulator
MISDKLAKGRLVVACDRWPNLAEPHALAWNRAAPDRPAGREFRDFLVKADRRLRRGA